MTKVFDMKLKGARELEELMIKHLPATVSRRVMLRSIHDAARPMLMLAKFYAPKDSRALSISIGLKSWSMTQTRSGDNPWKGAFAGVSMGPMTGTGKDALKAWAVYMAHHGRQVDLQRRKTIGRIRHGHLVEFGFRMRNGKRYPARRFMESAAVAGAPSFVSGIVQASRARIQKAIRRHNAKSPARIR